MYNWYYGTAKRKHDMHLFRWLYYAAWFILVLFILTVRTAIKHIHIQKSYTFLLLSNKQDFLGGFESSAVL